MYNHYIPQSDGSYRRNYVPENNTRRQPQRSSPAIQHQQTPPPKREEPKPEQESASPKQAVCPPQEPPSCSSQASASCPPYSPQPHQEHSPLAFLKKLLPKDLDSYDMIIIALLLLLSNDDCDEDIAPLLTIALYFLL